MINSGSARFVVFQVRGDLAFNHLALAAPHRRHIDHHRVGHRAELRGVTRQMCHLRAANFILARHTGDVRTCPADPLTLHDRSALTQSRHMPRDQLATSPAAKDQDIETFRLRHAYSPLQTCCCCRLRRSLGASDRRRHLHHCIDLCAVAPMHSRSFGVLRRRTLRNGHRVAEKPNDLMGNLRGGSAHIDRQRVLARIRFLESVDLASQQRRRHEMAVASRQMFGDQVPTAAKIDQPYFGSVADDDLAIGSFKRGARDDARLLLGALSIDPGRDTLQPGKRSASVSGMPACILAMFDLRMERIALLERPAEPR